MKQKKITQSRLKKLLNYNPETGIWTWIKPTGNRVNVGSIAGHVSKTQGYRVIRIDNKLYLSSNLANLYINGTFPKIDMDHKDRVRDNDKWDNLREISRSGNIINSSVRSDNKSGVVGVSWNKERCKWKSCIHLNGKDIVIGFYEKENFKEAVQDRYDAEIKYGFVKYNKNSTSRKYLKEHNEKIC